MALITLTTDFGTRDAYVAAVKGVLLGFCPGAQIVDVTHEVPPQDVRAGAFLLAQAAPYFPPGTIHLAVVDPGVGSARRAIAVATARAFFVGPDNGLFGWCLRGVAHRAALLARPELRLPEVSRTFHGRDVFAPAAAQLARGVPLEELGPRVESLVPLAIPEARVLAQGAEGEVVHVDHYGNLITNLAPGHVPAGATVVVGAVEAGPLVGAYADAPPGELCALVGSMGLVEVSVRDGSAAQRLGVGRGTRVRARASGRGAVPR